ncbi:MAG: hypothetical protein WC867_02710 [Candidatus Pacearchaeota archaeon]|jgi:hypothetical protein
MEKLDLKEYLRNKYYGELIDFKSIQEKPSYLEDVIARAIPRIHPMNRFRTLTHLYQALEDQEKKETITNEHFEIRGLERVPDNEEIISETVQYFSNKGYIETYKEGFFRTLKNDYGEVVNIQVESGLKHISVKVQTN